MISLQGFARLLFADRKVVVQAQMFEALFEGSESRPHAIKPGHLLRPDNVVLRTSADERVAHGFLEFVSAWRRRQSNTCLKPVPIFSQGNPWSRSTRGTGGNR
jgi:hypothetical protein